MVAPTAAERASAADSRPSKLLSFCSNVFFGNISTRCSNFKMYMID
jgi:hypothetical protein